MTTPVSRTKRFWVRLAVAAVGAAAFAGEARAQIGWAAAGGDVCAPAGEVCTSQTTVTGVVTEKRTCVRWKPVTETVMRRQECLTYRDECRVGYRQEQYVECVPKTCYDQVTVDEGCWKMVWCPKPVTKVVPRQTVEQRVACRAVPYTYVQKVPQVVCRMVPECRTKYVPETYTMCFQRPFSTNCPPQQYCGMPSVTCAAPAAEPSCSTPSFAAPAGQSYAPATPVPTFAPQTPIVDPGAIYNPAVPAGVVPDPTPDPMSSYYPTSPAAAEVPASGSATWTKVKPRGDAAPGAGEPTGSVETDFGTFASLNGWSPAE